MKLAFYKVNHHKATIIDKIIAWWTSDFKKKFNGGWKRGYSHAEIVFSDGVMVSSSPRDKGVRAKPHIFNPEVWDYIDVSELNESLAKEFTKTQIGKSYDYLGVLGFVIAIRDNESKWFCSEFVSRTLQIAGCIKLGAFNSARISPNRLYRLLHKNLK